METLDSWIDRYTTMEAKSKRMAAETGKDEQVATVKLIYKEFLQPDLKPPTASPWLSERAKDALAARGLLDSELGKYRAASPRPLIIIRTFEYNAEKIHCLYMGATLSPSFAEIALDTLWWVRRRHDMWWHFSTFGRDPFKKSERALILSHVWGEELDLKRLRTPIEVRRFNPPSDPLLRAEYEQDKPGWILSRSDLEAKTGS